MAWLAGYTKRIKLTTDNTKVDSTLSNFPTTVFFNSAQAEEIFNEFDANSDYMKCAFTLSDGNTQLYAEKELFDVWNSQYPTAHSDTYVKSTTKNTVNYWAYYGTDPAKSLTGTYLGNSWLSASGTTTNQRFHIDLGSAEIIRRIYYENNHNSGAITDIGVQNFTFWGSNTGAGTFDDLVYVNDEGWTELTVSQNTFDQHVASDAADPKYITVTNTVAYRYYAFKFADNYGNGSIMGVRHIVLQGGEAIYHVKVPSISSSADTDIYYYYNNSIADNTTYIGAINTTAGGTVWDSNFKAVYHMVDATTSTVVDSTSNNNDGTKKGAEEPIEATGKVGQGQTYDAVDDYLQVADAATLDFGAGDFTLEAIVKTSNQESRIFYKGVYGGADGMFRIYYRSSDPYVRVSTYHDSAGVQSDSEPTDYADNAYHHIVGQRDGDYLRVFADGAEKGTAISGADAVDVSSDNTLYLGAEKSTGTFRIKTLDEMRISNSARSAAWIKATYNSLWNSLLTYGSEEIYSATFNYFGYNST